MKVDDLILQLQDLINDAKAVPFSGGKVMVNSDEVYDIIDQIQDSMPAEVRQAKNARRRQRLRRSLTTQSRSQPKSEKPPTYTLTAL